MIPTRFRAGWLRVRALLRKELRQLFRDPKTRRVIFGSPVIQLILFGYAVTTDVHSVKTFVVDHDATAESRALLDAFTASGYFRVIGYSDQPRALAEALDAGRAVIGLEIPRGFAADLAAGRGATIQILVDGTHSNTATVAQGYATRFVQRFGAEWVREHGVGMGVGSTAAAARSTYGAAASTAGGAGSLDLTSGSMFGAAGSMGLTSGSMIMAAPRGSMTPVDLRARAWFNPGLESRVYNIPAVVGVLILFMSLLLTALSVVRERELGTLEQLAVSPLTPRELLLGKTIPVAIVIFVDLILIIAAGLLWFQVPFRGSALLLFFVSAVFALIGIGVGLYISTISRTQQEAFMGMFLFFLPSTVLAGFMYPIRSMPYFFQIITFFNPTRHVLEVVREIFLKGAGIAELWPQLLLLSLMAVGVMYLASRRFGRALR